MEAAGIEPASGHYRKRIGTTKRLFGFEPSTPRFQGPMTMHCTERNRSAVKVSVPAVYLAAVPRRLFPTLFTVLSTPMSGSAFGPAAVGGDVGWESFEIG